MIADGKTRDRYGVIWPAGFEVCEECGQPDNCGDCNHEPLSQDDVVQLLKGMLSEARRAAT